MTEPISVQTANLWKDNPRKEDTVKGVLNHGSTFICVHEGQRFADLLREYAPRYGYDLFGEGRGPYNNNPVLVQQSPNIEVVDYERRTISDRVIEARVGRISPIRTATLVKTIIEGERRAVIGTHFNAYVQRGYNVPRKLPRVQEFIEGLKDVTRWADRLHNQGWNPVVAADVNWGYGRRRIQEWWWSPQRAFKRRAGMVSHFRDFNPPGRDIEDVYYHPQDYRYLGTESVKPEWSDHPIYEVTLRPKD